MCREVFLWDFHFYSLDSVVSLAYSKNFYSLDTIARVPGELLLLRSESIPPLLFGFERFEENKWLCGQAGGDSRINEGERCS